MAWSHQAKGTQRERILRELREGTQKKRPEAERGFCPGRDQPARSGICPAPRRQDPTESGKETSYQGSRENGIKNNWLKNVGNQSREHNLRLYTKRVTKCLTRFGVIVVCYSFAVLWFSSDRSTDIAREAGKRPWSSSSCLSRFSLSLLLPCCSQFETVPRNKELGPKTPAKLRTSMAFLQLHGPTARLRSSEQSTHVVPKLVIFCLLLIGLHVLSKKDRPNTNAVLFPPPELWVQLGQRPYRISTRTSVQLGNQKAMLKLILWVCVCVSCLRVPFLGCFKGN